MAMAAIPCAAAAAASSRITNNHFNGTTINPPFTTSSSLITTPTRTSSSRSLHIIIRAIKGETKQRQTTTSSSSSSSPSSSSSSSTSSSPDEITRKYGLEVGLWKIFSSKEDDDEDEKDGDVKKSKGDQAKELLAKYGGAYLATSITLSLISFSLCYALITAGVDVQALLHKVGISANETGEKVGTFALAYAAHKAASPIRFPPTVALTPIVASWIGKKVHKDN